MLEQRNIESQNNLPITQTTTINALQHEKPKTEFVKTESREQNTIFQDLITGDEHFYCRTQESSRLWG